MWRKLEREKRWKETEKEEEEDDDNLFLLSKLLRLTLTLPYLPENKLTEREIGDGEGGEKVCETAAAGPESVFRESRLIEKSYWGFRVDRFASYVYLLIHACPRP